MKLSHVNLASTIDFTKNSIFSLIIENTDEYYRLTNEIVSQSNGKEGNWVFSEIYPIDLIKNILVLYDYYNLSCNNKKFDNLLKAELLKIACNSNYYENISKINAEIIKLNELLIQELDFSVVAKDEYNSEDLLKISKFTFQEEEELINKIINYVDVCSKLMSLKLVVFIGLFSVLNEFQIIKLEQELKYKDINILFIDNQDKYKLENVSKIIIDNDLCEI